ncbi:MAG: DUF2892 domain-containing protein [Micavibrio sp.]
MKCNVGKTDRALRIAIGSLIIILGLYTHSWIAVLGFIPLVTGLVKWCPLYVPFKITSK